jgi:DNA-binding MarR family transcriptional regulator
VQLKSSIPSPALRKPSAVRKVLSEESRQLLPGALADHASFLLGKASRTIREMAGLALEPLGINPAQYAILATTASEGPLCQQDLGERLRIDRTTIVTLVDGLEQLQAVVRETHPQDRRAYLVSLTPHGRELLAHGEASLERAQEQFLKPLSGEEWVELRRLLTKLYDHHC